MERNAPSSEDSNKQKRSNLFYGILVVILSILLVAICVVFFILFTYLPSKIFPPSRSASTLTPLSTATFKYTSTVTFTATPSATRTATPTATASVTPLPTFTPTKNPSPTSAPTKTPQPDIIKYSSYRVTYQRWIGVRRIKAYKNGLRCSSIKGQEISYTTPVKSKKVAILFFKGPDQGKTRIIIDGKVKETVDLYNKSSQFQFERTYTGLSDEKHTIQVVVLGTKRTKSQGFWVCVDGFIYNNTRVDDSYDWVNYEPWHVQTSANNPNFRVASVKGASIDFTFNGSTFFWVTATGFEGGLADIYVDNKFIRTVDLYSPTPQLRKRIRVDNLGNKKHTVKIIVLGQKNPASNGKKIYLNRILYY